MDFYSEYKARQGGYLHNRHTRITFYHARYPGPPEERVLSNMVSDEMLDSEFESGGVKAVQIAIERVLTPIFQQLAELMLRPYEEAANRPAREAFGPLGVFTDIGRMDIIQKIALKEHEDRRASEREVREEPGD